MSATAFRISAVLFDADGVIQRTSSTWRANLLRLCNDPARANQLLTELFAAERFCFDGTQDFRLTLAEALARWGRADALDEALAVWTEIEPDPHILEVVAELRRNEIRVALASNQQAIRAKFMSEELGYAAQFDHLFYSCLLGHAKPSTEYFEQALRRLALPGGSVLFLDDREVNVAAARSVGLHAELAQIDHGAAGMRQLLSRYGLPID
ncbi:MAG: HAD-IA family hydrolase [Steroidobacteraceae bacterium]